MRVRKCLAFVCLVQMLFGEFAAEGGKPGVRPCGTVLRPEDRPIVERLQQQGAYSWRESVAGAGPRHVAVTFHVVRRTNGNGGVSQAALSRAIEDANRQFADAGIEFCQRGPVLFIDDDSLYGRVDTHAEIDSLRSIDHVCGTVNVYIVPALASDSTAFCSTPPCSLAGYSSFSWSPVQGIALNSSYTPAFGDHSTFSHELGHYFDLFHTHEQELFGIECVARTNCAQRGDKLCDTPADPGLGLFGNVRQYSSGECRYTGSHPSPCAGDLPYDPMVSNLMSYAPQRCTDTFTPEQSQKALSCLVTRRPELAGGSCGLVCSSSTITRDDHVTINFGQAVAACGDLAVIGSWENGHGSTNPFVIFRRHADQWVSEATNVLQQSTGYLEPLSLAIGDDAVIVGKPSDSGGDTLWSGSVRLLRHTAGAWAEQQKLVASDAREFALFGASVRVFGDLLVIGAPGGGDFCEATGTVYVFRRQSDAANEPVCDSSSDSLWIEEAKLVPATLPNCSLFGTAVGVSHDLIFVGSPTAGSVHVYRRSLKFWELQEIVTASDSRLNDRFGSSIATNGHFLAVGAPGANSVYFFRQVNARWVEAQKVTPLDRGLGGEFGAAVAITATEMWIGAPAVEFDGFGFCPGGRLETCEGFGPPDCPPERACRRGECTMTFDCQEMGRCSGYFLEEGTPCGERGESECDEPDTCDGDGKCERHAKPDGTACTSDGVVCNGPEVCMGGICVHGAGPSGCCDTDEDCRNANVCDGIEACVNGSCVVSGALNCNDQRRCTKDRCVPTEGCLHENLPTDTPCFDPRDGICDHPDTCDGTGNCHTNRAPDGTPCADGIFCNGAEYCFEGRCGAAGTSDVPRCCQSDADCVGGPCDASGVCVNPWDGIVYRYQLHGGSWREHESLAAPEFPEDSGFGGVLSIAADSVFVGTPINESGFGGHGAVFAIPLGPDCNGNSVVDQCDIESGASKDLDRDGVPDECPLVPTIGDWDRDGDEDLRDVAGFLTCFGRVVQAESSAAGADVCFNSFDLDVDNSIDLSDFELLSMILSGPR